MSDTAQEMDQSSEAMSNTEEMIAEPASEDTDHGQQSVDSMEAASDDNGMSVHCMSASRINF